MEKIQNDQPSLEALLPAHSNVIISVIGPHAGEPLGAIFARKIRDISDCGSTFWVSKSRAITPAAITRSQEESKEDELYILFIKTSIHSEGRDTRHAEAAEVYEESPGVWRDLDPRLSPVTGKMPSRAFKFDRIRMVEEKRVIDLGEYEELDGGNIRIMMGKSTICVRRAAGKREMKNGVREIVAFARLASPFLVRLSSRKRLEAESKKGNGRCFGDEIRKKIKK